MRLPIAIDILSDHNKWRRGDDAVPASNPRLLGIAIDTILEHLKNEQPVRP